jgi:hypothetical protein
VEGRSDIGQDVDVVVSVDAVGRGSVRHRGGVGGLETMLLNVLRTIEGKDYKTSMHKMSVAPYAY